MPLTPQQVEWLESRPAFNMSSIPVVDRNGRPFTEKCRVRFRDVYYYINIADGTGVVRHIDDLGCIYIETDAPWAKYDRDGFCRGTTFLKMFPASYQYDGEFKGMRAATRLVGDPWEHGQYEIYVEIIDETR